MKYCFLFIILFIATISFGQIDTFYVKPSPFIRTIALHSTYKDFKLSFSSSVSDEIVLQNSSLGLGFRLRYKNVGFSMSVPVATFHQSALGKPKNFGVGFNIFPAAIFLQGTFQYIKGFENLSVSDNSTTPVFHPNNRMVFARVIGNYAFNHKRYSLSAAFKMINLQKRSAGSWIVSVPINYQSYDTDSLSLPIKDQPDFRFGLYRSFKIGIGGGYAYTQVWGDWSATLFAVGGAELRQIRYSDTPTSEPNNKLLISPRIRIVSSVLYNTPAAFCGIVGNYLPGIDAADGINARVRNVRIRMIYGRRF